MEIAFRADGGGAGYGLGHLMRCLAVAEAFQAKNCKCFFVCRDYPEGVQLLQDRGNCVHTIPVHATVEEDLRSSRELLNTADIIFVDGYNFSTEYLSHLQPKFVVYFDDLLDKKLPVDAVIGNVYAKSEDYKDKVRSKTLVLSGPQYIPLRKGFQNLPRKTISENIRRVLLTFGGEDPANVTMKIVEALSTYPEKFILDILLGAAYRYRSELEKSLKNCNREFHIHSNVKDVVPLFQQVDLAISAGSTTLWELAAVGVPMMIIQTADNQCRNALYVQEQKLGLVLGWREAVNDIQIHKGLAAIADVKKRLEFSRRCQDVVDGNGALRIADAVLKDYETHQVLFRKADPNPSGSDSRLLWEWRNDPLTRQMSVTTDPIAWESHQQWYGQAVQDPKRLILLALVGKKPVGTIRFDSQDSRSAEINININPNLRGHGVGGIVLHKACAYAFNAIGLKLLVAKVKQENLSSIKIFENAGFELKNSSNGLRFYQLSS